MWQKDYSLSKKEGWQEYSSRSWLLFPKVYDSSFLTYIFYAVTGSFAYFLYENGGIEKTAKLYLK